MLSPWARSRSKSRFIRDRRTARGLRSGRCARRYGRNVHVRAAPLLERLGVKPFRTVPVRFANGDVAEWPMGEVEMELDGQRMPVLTLFGAPDAPALLGAHALEAFLLMADPVAKKLVRSEAYLMATGR